LKKNKERGFLGFQNNSSATQCRAERKNGLRKEPKPCGEKEPPQKNEVSNKQTLSMKFYFYANYFIQYKRKKV